MKKILNFPLAERGDKLNEVFAALQAVGTPKEVLPECVVILAWSLESPEDLEKLIDSLRRAFKAFNQ